MKCVCAILRIYWSLLLGAFIPDCTWDIQFLQEKYGPNGNPWIGWTASSIFIDEWCHHSFHLHIHKASHNNLIKSQEFVSEHIRESGDGSINNLNLKGSLFIYLGKGNLALSSCSCSSSGIETLILLLP